MKQLTGSFVFLGNGPVASASLEGLIKSFGPAAIEAVITKERPKHHKDPAPVEELAKVYSLPLWFASTKSELQSLIEEKQPTSKVGMVIDYGVIIGEQTIQYFEKGILNSHFSLLPEWRGADPITYSLLSGQKTTGASIMVIDAGLDTGPLLSRTDLPLKGTETATELTKSLVELSNQLLDKTLPEYLANQIQPKAQSPGPTTYSRKLTKQDSVLIFTKTATELEREVRAFSGWPGSRTSIAGIDCLILKTKVQNVTLQPGELQVTPEKTLLIGCQTNSLEILELKPAGKAAMPISAFINGYGNRLS